MTGYQLKNLKLVFTLFFLLKGSAICENRNSFFNYYNPDVVIQSAFIKDGINLEYSFPDLTSLSHLRLTIEVDSLYTLHFGVGYPSLDIGLSTHLFSWQENSVRLLFFGGTSSLKGQFFFQGNLISSLYKNNKTEFGISFSTGYNFYGMWEVHCEGLPFCNLIKDYTNTVRPSLYFKQDIYYMLQFSEHLNIGIATGLTEGFYNSGELIRFQFGLSMKYLF